MPGTYKTTSFVGKINGQLVKGNLLSDADVLKVKTYHGKVDTLVTDLDKLEARFDASITGEKQIAEYDFYTDETHKDKMEVNRVYMVYFKDDGTFVAPTKDGDHFWPDGEVPTYYWLVRKDQSGTVHKMQRVNDTGNPLDFLSKTNDNEFLGYMMRTVQDADVVDGDAVPYMTKFMGITAGANPTKALYTGHLALDKDGKKLFGHTGVVDKSGARQASLGVYKNDGTPAGEVCLKSTADGSKVTLTIPQPDLETAADNEAVTIKALKDHVASMPNFSYQATKPDDGEIEDGSMVFFDATNLL